MSYKNDIVNFCLHQCSQHSEAERKNCPMIATCPLYFDRYSKGSGTSKLYREFYNVRFEKMKCIERFNGMSREEVMKCHNKVLNENQLIRLAKSKYVYGFHKIDDLQVYKVDVLKEKYTGIDFYNHASPTIPILIAVTPKTARKILKKFS